jgi:hypothetical protein
VVVVVNFGAAIADINTGVEGIVSVKGPFVIGADVEAVNVLGELATGDFFAVVQLLAVGTNPDIFD